MVPFAGLAPSIPCVIALGANPRIITATKQREPSRASFVASYARVNSARLRPLEVELVENAGRGIQNLLIHLAVRSDGFGQRNGNNLVASQRRHLTEFAAMHHVDRAQSVARRQYTIESAGRSAALDVAEHHRSRFEARPLFDLAGHASRRFHPGGVAEFVALFRLRPVVSARPANLAPSAATTMLKYLPRAWRC